MADAHWKATIFYGDKSSINCPDRVQNFPVDNESEARDWIETAMESIHTWIDGGVEYRFPTTTIHHTRLEFIEETPDES